MLDEYEDQLAAAEIPFHLEWVKLADGIGSVTARWKFEYMREMCLKFADYQRIIFTDAWDVLFFGTKAELMAKIPELLVVSAERNCWPEPHLAGQFDSPSPWRYCNAGMMAGNPQSIIKWIEGLRGTVPEMGLMEQQWFNRRIAEGELGNLLDDATELFYTVSYDREDGLLTMSNGRPFNSRCETFPCWLHFAGPCSSVPFRAMLRGATPDLRGNADGRHSSHHTA